MTICEVCFLLLVQPGEVVVKKVRNVNKYTFMANNTLDNPQQSGNFMRAGIVKSSVTSTISMVEGIVLLCGYLQSLLFCVFKSYISIIL